MEQSEPVPPKPRPHWLSHFARLAWIVCAAATMAQVLRGFAPGKAFTDRDVWVVVGWSGLAAAGLQTAAYAAELRVTTDPNRRHELEARMAMALGFAIYVSAPLTRSPEGMLLGGVIFVMGVVLDHMRRVPFWTRSHFSPFDVTVLALTMSVIWWTAFPSFKVARTHDPKRQCYANQKTISGAIEMYELDRNKKVHVLDLQLFQALKSGGYLQSIPRDPGAGPGSSRNYAMTLTGNRVRCDQHGALE